MRPRGYWGLLAFATLSMARSAGLSRYPEHLVEARVERLKDSFYELLDDDEFSASITLGTNQVNRVMARFAKTNEMLQEVFDDYAG